LTETGGGKVLDPFTPTLNPFLQDRKKTFQPRPLWEWLVKFAILLFVIDVGVRRVQIDREEWQKALQTVRHKILGAPRKPVETDQSLAALLARRDSVRSKQPAPVEAPASLFEPVHAPAETVPAETSSSGAHTPGPAPQPSIAAAPTPPEESTTSRLLEAKRRAQKRR
jgi:hypothetical protein